MSDGYLRAEHEQSFRESTLSPATRVLLVQDEHDDGAAIRDFCSTSARHITITVVATRAECWATLATNNGSPFDALVIDDALPDSDSITLLHEIVSAGYPAPVIVITARTDVETAVATMKEGATDYLVKSGAYWEHLPRVIESAIAHYGLIRENQRLHGTLANYAASLEETVRQAQLEKTRLQAVLEQLPEGVMIVEGDEGHVVAVNTTARRLGGQAFLHDGDQPADAGLHQLEHLDGTPMLANERPIARVLRDGQPVLGEQVVLVQPDGGRITVLTNAAPLIDLYGMVIGAVAVFQDISEIKRLEHLKDEVLSIASHELKNPLTIIKGYSTLLLKAPSVQQDKRIYRIATTIGQQSERMHQLVERLLDLSRLDLGTMTLCLNPVDLSRLLCTIAQEQSTTTPNHTLHCHSIEPELILMADQVRLEQVFSNLVSNAIKYSPGGGEIVLTLHVHTELSLDSHIICGSEVTAPGPYAVAAVSDQGIGIAPEMQQQLFNRFYRAREAARLAAGQGLGLYICAEIVRMHGGTLCVESSPEKGSTFRVVLPIRSE